MKPEAPCVAAALAALLVSTAAAIGKDTAAASPLAPLGFLAGHCWVTRIDADETDTHCYEWMHGGQQLRDRHVVRGKNPDYLGETVYAYNGERKRVEYRYWNSLGGESDGYVEIATDGQIEFLDDRYVGSDGVVYVFASEMTRPSDVQYRMVSRYKEGDAWREMWTRMFDREPSAMGQQSPASPEALAAGVAQLRHVIGLWNVTTTQYAEDGSIAGTMPGTYRFEWVVPDRVISGRSDIPEQGLASGILFYVRERRATIEMASVGADGHLWVMTGPVDGESRTTPPTPLADGGTMQLRFTRFNVDADRFESKMEVSLDGGKTWKPGNHQIFTRADQH